MYTQTKRKSGNFFLKRMLLASYLKVHLQVYELGHKDQGAKKVSFTGLFCGVCCFVQLHVQCAVARTAAQHCIEGIGGSFFFPLNLAKCRKKKCLN